MSIDTNRFLDDTVQNMVSLLQTQKSTWQVTEVFPFQAVLKGIYPCIEVNATGASIERIESGGGCMIDVRLDIFYWFQQFNKQFAKRQLDQRTSNIALFIASNPTLGGYGDDVFVDTINITALPDQQTKSPIMVSVISCRVRKEVFLEYS